MKERKRAREQERKRARGESWHQLFSLVRSFVLSLFLLVLLFACSDDNRQTAHIPDFPKSGDSSRAEGALRALTRSINQSSSSSAYAKRAVILLAMGRVSDALADIDEAISRNDNIGSFYLTRAQIDRKSVV